MIKSVLPYLALPKGVSNFEVSHLAKMNRIGLVFFALHLPAFVAVAFFNDTGPLLAVALTSLTLVGPFAAYFTFSNPRHVSMVMGFTAMIMGGLLVHFGQGPVQIEMHFYFFSMLAVLVMFGNPAVILTAAVTVTVHHLTIWYFLPSSIFNYDASFWVVAVHAGFVVLESVAACYISRNYFDNVIGLEKIVSQRTSALDARNQDLRLVMDNVGQGFFTVDAQGVVSAERSRAVEAWLGEIPPGATLSEVYTGLDEDMGMWFDIAWESIIDDIMPLEICLDQLPSQFTKDGRHLLAEYRTLGVEGAFEGLLVVISDITDRVAQEAAEAEQRELLAVFEKVMRDKVGFVEFLVDADGLVRALSQGEYRDDAECKRWLHTLKGNAGLFGLLSISRACHALEDDIAETGELPTEQALKGLHDRWLSTHNKLGKLLGSESSDVFEVREEEYEAMLRAIRSNESHQRLAATLQRWRMEPTSLRLERLARQARAIAGRLEKSGLQVQVEHNDTRLDPQRWRAFWSSFVHVVRNAVDHGIEHSDERAAAGKESTGTLSFRTFSDNEEFVIEVEDDGRGIAWEQIRQRAERLKLPTQSHRDLVEALFVDGMSTRDQVSETSGRGVGMGAVRAACKDLGGRVEVRSDTGSGTCFQFRFPHDAMFGDKALAA